MILEEVCGDAWVKRGVRDAACLPENNEKLRRERASVALVTIQIYHWRKGGTNN